MALVDDEDYDRLKDYSWSIRSGGTIARSTYKMYKAKAFSLASEIMKRPGIMFDHKDCNSLNNQKENLRQASYSQNRANTVKRKGSYSSKYKGVCKTQDNKWRATIGYNCMKINIGTFINEEVAALAYDAKAKELYGEFARTNF